MTILPTTEALSEELSVALAEFARACKGATRAFSLYPGTHPAIRQAMSRVAAATGGLTAAGNVALTVHPAALVVDGRAPAKPDPAVAELASLLHERLVGALRVEREADADDWRALLLLLGRAPDDLIAAGGIAAAWAACGRSHFEIREIDYAEVLRERSGADGAEWDHILAHCLRDDSGDLDERTMAALVAAVSDPTRFGELLDHLQQAPGLSGATIGARAAALLRLLRSTIEAAGRGGPAAADQALQTVAEAAGGLAPAMLMAVLAARHGTDAGDAALASAIANRMSDGTIASFVAGSVAAERRATERLAQAFEALVPDSERKERLLQTAEAEARQTELGDDPGFDALWQGASDMLMSYSDKNYVSDAYDSELSAARTQAIEVERVSSDPPERVQQWLTTVTDPAVRQLDLDLLLDLLRIEEDAQPWQAVAGSAAAEAERRTVARDMTGAQQLVESLARELGPDGRPQLRAPAAQAMTALSSGALVHHVVLHLRKAEDAEMEAIVHLCRTIGPGVVRPLAEALAVEEHNRAIRRLRELLLGFGADGRQSVEQLKSSSNPAVRRTAIDLLRVFGGHEALPELASMLDDADPQVQRESIRAIVQIGTPAAYAVLERALASDGVARETIVQQLVGLRDDKTMPLLCHVLDHTAPRGRFAQVHAEVIEALGGMGPHPLATRTLRDVLYRSNWRAPFRTAALRRAAAGALRRLGSDEAAAVLDAAAQHGSRGVRNAAQTAIAARRDRERA